MESLTKEVRRCPAELWDTLQDVCYRNDAQFLQDVSRVIDIPLLDLKRAVFGVRGKDTTVLVEHGPWWEGVQCSVMERSGSLWNRCGGYSESNGHCYAHRHAHYSDSIRPYDDTYFTLLRKVRPVNLEGAIVWVDNEGAVRDRHGRVLKEYLIDISKGILYNGI